MTLEILLRRIRDGHASEDEVAACRALVATDPRVPDEIRDDLLGEDLAGDAAGLLAILVDEPEGLGLAGALRQELAEEMAFDPAELDLAWG
ncbi:MAG: hypothetical protein H0V89_14945, partial [Deltaproteobacteria bacterium]|nr:hypothetical protein [Deltaproteobacteria bacterium]